MLAAAASRRAYAFLAFVADPRRTSRIVLGVLLAATVAFAIWHTRIPASHLDPAAPAEAGPLAAQDAALPLAVAAAAGAVGSHSKDFYYNLLKEKTKGELMGEWNTNLLVPLLAAFYTHQRQNKVIGKGNIFIDVGAHTGWYSGLVIDYFSNHRCRKIRKRNGALHPWHCEEMHEVFIAFEPLESNLQYQRLRAQAEEWSLAPWIGVKAAVSDRDANMKIYSRSVGQPGPPEAPRIDRQASLAPAAARAAENDSADVRSFRLDSFLFRGPHFAGKEGGLLVPELIGEVEVLQDAMKIPDWQVYLLKIDAEGFDGWVVRGTEELLRQKRVKYLVFEYNPKWFETGRQITLKETLSFLDGLGYICYWILKDYLIPASGTYWVDAYEDKSWSNFFCGRKTDPELAIVLRLYSHDLFIGPLTTA
ncbi:S-adenosyl-L-methionine-dependent methyltransferase [Hyaloraphidium curvatum]|nr:S-adenosyl-L-methionine-dependent methyltransferase [Hyaloraphidium curvatum]